MSPPTARPEPILKAQTQAQEQCETKNRPGVTRASFASVAALAAAGSSAPSAPSASSMLNNGAQAGKSVATPDKESENAQTVNTESLRESVARLNIVSKPGPIIASAELGSHTPISERLRLDDEKTQLSSISNPTVSTDVRSTVSGTTFGLDEKESIRPDESASVKAADEDESNSGPNSGGQQSLAGSEAGKAFRDQFFEISGAKRALPLTTNLVQRMPDETGGGGSAAATMAFVCPPPDEKLLEALQSQRDRMFLLQMEQQVIDFVKNSKEQSLHLPPENAFCRLLAHRLADYYNLSHAAEPGGSVRIGKSDSPRLPPPLSDIANQQTLTQPTVAIQPTLKIMRRMDKANGTGSRRSTTTDDPLPSGPASIASDQGSSSNHGRSDRDELPPRDTKRPTLEEREAKYNARREELYKDISEKQSAENSNAVSRASSLLGGQKTKKRAPRNDDFEPRSVYAMGYNNAQATGAAYGGRPLQPGYGFQPAAGGRAPEMTSQHFGQANIGQDGYMQDTTGFYPPAYGFYNGQGYYDPRYQSFNASQTPSQYMNAPLNQPNPGMSAYAMPVPGSQSIPQYSMPHYDPRMGAYLPGPGNLHGSYPHGLIGQQPNYAGQYSPSSQQDFQRAAQSADQSPPMHFSPRPGHIGGSNAFSPNQMNGGPHNRHSHTSFHGAQMSPSSSAFGDNAGMQAMGQQLSPPGSGQYQAVSYSQTGQMPKTQWPPSAKGAIRTGARPNDFFVPRYDHNGQQIPQRLATTREQAPGQLRKYDTSTLPPKPPAPVSASPV